MDHNLLAFPPRVPSQSPDTTQPNLNTRRRLYLYKPTEEEFLNRSLDLAYQVGIAVSHIEREIMDSITRDRQRRIFPSTPLATEN